MNPVDEVFAAFQDSPTKLARATNLKVQTVHDWRAKAPVGIPEWRRPIVLKALKKATAAISPTTLAYLQCREEARATSEVTV